MASFVKAASTTRMQPFRCIQERRSITTVRSERPSSKNMATGSTSDRLFSARASAAMAVLRFLGISGIMRSRHLLAKVPEVIQAIDNAGSAEELEFNPQPNQCGRERVSMDAVRAGEANRTWVLLRLRWLTWIACCVIATINSQARRRRPVQWTMTGSHSSPARAKAGSIVFHSAAAGAEAWISPAGALTSVSCAGSLGRAPGRNRSRIPWNIT